MPRFLTFLLIFPLIALGQSDNTPANNVAEPRELVDVEYVENLITTTVASISRLSNEFVGQWDESAITCQETRKKLFGNMSQECREIRAAIRHGDFSEFANNCQSAWASTMAAVNSAAIPSAEFENNKEYLTSLLNDYIEDREAYCLFAKFSESNAALYTFFEEARNSDANGFSNFSNVELSRQVFEGQRTLMDQNFEQERLRNENLLNQ